MFQNEASLLHFVSSLLSTIERPAKEIEVEIIEENVNSTIISAIADSVEYRLQCEKMVLGEGALEQWICKVWKRTDPTVFALPFIVTFQMAEGHAQGLTAFRQLHTGRL